MTYVHEYEIKGPMGPDFIKVEYCFSAVSDSIKVVDMWVNGKEHKITWRRPEGRAKLMDRLEQDMEDRMCGTLDDITVGGVDTEMDLERDIPQMTAILGEA